MPFTLAHPAIVVPLKNRGLNLSMTGLIIGSTVPDMEFFLQMREVENIGHNWYGIFVFNLPMAIFLSYLFHNLFRNSLVSNLPQIYRSRFIHLTSFNWNEYASKNKIVVVVSMFIGITSHLFWDSFTHYDGFFVELIPALSNEINLMNFKVPTYFLLQIVFSILGMIIVHLQIMKLPLTNESINHKIDYSYWILLSLLFFTLVSFRIIMWPEFNSFGGIAIAIMGSIFYSLLPISFLYNKFSTIKIKN